MGGPPSSGSWNYDEVVQCAICRKQYGSGGLVLKEGGPLNQHQHHHHRHHQQQRDQEPQQQQELSPPVNDGVGAGVVTLDALSKSMYDVRDRVLGECRIDTSSEEAKYVKGEWELTKEFESLSMNGRWGDVGFEMVCKDCHDKYREYIYPCV
jgi:hypothetical protein